MSVYGAHESWPPSLSCLVLTVNMYMYTLVNLPFWIDSRSLPQKLNTQQVYDSCNSLNFYRLSVFNLCSQALSGYGIPKRKWSRYATIYSLTSGRQLRVPVYSKFNLKWSLHGNMLTYEASTVEPTLSSSLLGALKFVIYVLELYPYALRPLLRGKWWTATVLRGRYVFRNLETPSLNWLGDI